MKILSWDVNGIRACCDKGFVGIIEKYKPDIICLQEIKCDKYNIPYDVGQLLFDKYRYYGWNPASKKGYSGTAILSSIKPEKILQFTGNQIKENEGRITVAEYENFNLITAYVVNSKMDLSRLDYRVEWEKDILEYLKKYITNEKPFIYCGDLNCAIEPRDIWDPSKRFEPGCTDQERTCFYTLLSEGLFDVWRLTHEDEIEFTFWSYMGQSRKRNKGWRLDYFLCNKDAALKVKSTENLIYEEGSDHCPILLDINI